MTFALAMMPIGDHRGLDCQFHAKGYSSGPAIIACKGYSSGPAIIACADGFKRFV
jgi:uncharacterized protein YoaH (UPF0181 family)